jgi:hypothetical protein
MCIRVDSPRLSTAVTVVTRARRLMIFMAPIIKTVQYQ